MTSTPPVPQNIAAEEATLGALLINGRALRQVHFLRPAHFYLAKNGWIFRTIQTVSERQAPVDVLTVCDELERQGQLDAVGGSSYVTSLLNAVPTALHVEHYARLVHRAAVLRQLVSRAGQIARLAHESTGSAGETVRQAQALLADLENDPETGSWVRMDEALTEIAANGALGTGLPGLDARLNGLWPGQLVGLVDGSPTRIAATLAYQIALHQALRGVAVFICSPRASRAVLTRQLWGQVAGVSPDRLRDNSLSPAEQQLVTRAQELLAATPLYLDDASPAVEELGARLQHGRHWIGVRLAVVEVAERGTGSVPPISILWQAARTSRVPLLALASDAADCQRWADTMLVFDGSVGVHGKAAQSIDLIVLRQGEEAGRVQLCFDQNTRRFTNGRGPDSGSPG